MDPLSQPRKTYKLRHRAQQLRSPTSRVQFDNNPQRKTDSDLEKPKFPISEALDNPTTFSAAMQPGSANIMESPLLPRTLNIPYTVGYSQIHESMTAMQPEESVALNEFPDSSSTFALPEPIDYSPEDLMYMPGWNSNNQYNFSDSYARPDTYGSGYHNANGEATTHGDPQTNLGPNTYGVNGAESSDQQDLWSPNFQTGQGISDVDFDIASFQMPARTLTQNPAPISSADVFDNNPPFSFENMLSEPHFSPTCSPSSSHSSHDSNWSIPRTTTAQPETYMQPNVPTNSSSNSPLRRRTTSASQSLPDTTNAKPHRCTQRGCSRSYARKFELYRHQRRHTGVRSHHCQVEGCERGPRNGFFRKDHLSQHMRQVHGS